MKRSKSQVMAIAAVAVIMMLISTVPLMAGEAESTTIQGTLVDVACANANTKKPKPDFATKHSKDCLQMPDCEKSGYAVLTSDNKVIHFDAKGNQLAKQLIDKTDKENDFKVSVKGTVTGDEIAVVSLDLE